MTGKNPIYEAQELEKYFYQESLLDTLLRRDGQSIKAVDGVSFSIEENDVIGIIGESGCGKTTLLKTLIGLYTPTGGELRFKGTDVTDYSGSQWNRVQQDVQMIFQNPFDSFNPRHTIRESILEPLKIHNMGDQEERVYDVLEQVELNPPEKFMHRKPGELSGGELQRAAIARALVTEPDVILADEPASMLDVSTQASLLNLLARLTDEGVAMIYISHDLSTVGTVCEEINVMYLGRIVEQGPTETILSDPSHPYTKELIKAIPIPDPDFDRGRTQISGSVPDPGSEIGGCRFKDRCPERMEICDIPPEFVPVNNSSRAACHLCYDHEEYTTNEADSEHSIAGQEGA